MPLEAIDPQALGDLPRRELQRLAKVHGLKANLKSAVLIERLKEQLHSSSPPPAVGKRPSLLQSPGWARRRSELHAVAAADANDPKPVSVPPAEDDDRDGLELQARAEADAIEPKNSDVPSSEVDDRRAALLQAKATARRKQVRDHAMKRAKVRCWAAQDKVTKAKAARIVQRCPGVHLDEALASALVPAVPVAALATAPAPAPAQVPAAPAVSHPALKALRAAKRAKRQQEERARVRAERQEALRVALAERRRAQVGVLIAHNSPARVPVPRRPSAKARPARLPESKGKHAVAVHKGQAAARLARVLQARFQ